MYKDDAIKDDLSLNDFLVYLESIADKFPCGIPESCLQSEQIKVDSFIAQSDQQLVCWGDAGASIVFLMTADTSGQEYKKSELVGEDGSLLAAAIEKGMRLTLEQVFFIRCLAEKTAGKTRLAGWRAAIEHLPVLLSARIVVALGAPAWDILAAAAARSGVTRGQWFKYQACLVMPTHKLETVLRVEAAKREFWNDLQLVMAEINK